jgi:hypothetical protein
VTVEADLALDRQRVRAEVDARPYARERSDGIGTIQEQLCAAEPDRLAVVCIQHRARCRGSQLQLPAVELDRAD